MTTCCSCGKAIKVIAKRFSAIRFAAFTFFPHIISGRCLVYSKLRKRGGGGCRGRWQAGNGWQKPKHSYDKASRRHIIKKPCLKLQQLEATLQQLLMNEWQYKWRGGVQKYGIADWTQKEGEGERGEQTNYAQDKQHADSSNSRGSSSCCCNLLLIYVEIKNEQQERERDSKQLQEQQNAEHK